MALESGDLMVSQATITAMIISMSLSVLIPVILIIIFKRKYKISIKVVLFGVLTFILFVGILEGAFNGLLLNSAATAPFFESAWVLVPYGALMAGIFEEVGRYIMMRFALKKYRDWHDGLAFGIGHGGIESILILGISNLTMIIYANQINAGTFDQLMANDTLKEVLMPIKEQLTATSPLMAALGPIERVCAIALHIALSILVMYAIKSGKMKYLIYAIAFHALFDVPAALYQTGILPNIFIVEAIIVLFAIIAVVYIVRSRKMWKSS